MAETTSAPPARWKFALYEKRGATVAILSLLLLLGVVLVIAGGVMLRGSTFLTSRPTTVFQRLRELELRFMSEEAAVMGRTIVSVRLPGTSTALVTGGLPLANVTKRFTACNATQSQRPIVRNVSSAMWVATLPVPGPGVARTGEPITFFIDTNPLVAGLSQSRSQVSVPWPSVSAGSIVSHMCITIDRGNASDADAPVKWNRVEDPYRGCVAYPFIEPFAFASINNSVGPNSSPQFFVIRVMLRSDPGLFAEKEARGDPLSRLCDGFVLSDDQDASAPKWPLPLLVVGCFLLVIAAVLLVGFCAFLQSLNAEDQTELTPVQPFEGAPTEDLPAPIEVSPTVELPAAGESTGSGGQQAADMAVQQKIDDATRRRLEEEHRLLLRANAQAALQSEESEKRLAIVDLEDATHDELESQFATSLLAARQCEESRRSKEVEMERVRIEQEEKAAREAEEAKRQEEARKREQARIDAANAAAAAERLRVEADVRRQKLQSELVFLQDAESIDRLAAEKDEASARDETMDSRLEAEALHHEKQRLIADQRKLEELILFFVQARAQVESKEAVARDDLCKRLELELLEAFGQADASLQTLMKQIEQRRHAAAEAERQRAAEVERIRQDALRRAQEAEDKRREDEQQEKLRLLEVQRAEQRKQEEEALRRAEMLRRRQAAKDKAKTEAIRRNQDAENERQRRVSLEAAANEKILQDAQRKQVANRLILEAAAQRETIDQVLAENAADQDARIKAAYEAHQQRVTALRQGRETVNKERQDLEETLKKREVGDARRNAEHLAYMSDLQQRFDEAARAENDARSQLLQAIADRQAAKEKAKTGLEALQVERQEARLREALAEAEENRKLLEVALEEESRRRREAANHEQFLSQRDRQRIADLIAEVDHGDEQLHAALDAERRSQTSAIAAAVAAKKQSQQALQERQALAAAEEAERRLQWQRREDVEQKAASDQQALIADLRKRREDAARLEETAKLRLEERRAQKLKARNEFESKAAADDAERLRVEAEAAAANGQLLDALIASETQRASWQAERFALLSQREKTRIAELFNEAASIQAVVASSVGVEQEKQSNLLANALNTKRAKALDNRRLEEEAKRLEEARLVEQRRSEDEARRRAEANERRRTAKAKAKQEAEARADAEDEARLKQAAELAAKNAQLLEAAIAAETQKQMQDAENAVVQLSVREKKRVEALMQEAAKIDAAQIEADAAEQRAQSSRVAANVAARKAKLEEVRRVAQAQAASAYAALLGDFTPLVIDDEHLFALQDDPREGTQEVTSAPSASAVLSSSASSGGTTSLHGLRTRLFAEGDSDPFYRIVAKDPKTRRERWTIENGDTWRELVVTISFPKGTEVMAKGPTTSQAAPAPLPATKTVGSTKSSSKRRSQTALRSAGAASSLGTKTDVSSTVDVTDVVPPGQVVFLAEVVVPIQPAAAPGSKSTASAVPQVTVVVRPVSMEFRKQLAASRVPMIDSEMDAVNRLMVGTTQSSDETCVQRCVAAGVPFVDSSFPPSAKSIFAESKEDPSPFARPSWYIGPTASPRLFFKFIEGADVDLGELDDDELMSGLIALTEFPSVIRRLFAHPQTATFHTRQAMSLEAVDTLVTKERNLGVYRVNLCVAGWWRNVIVDEFLPAGLEPYYAKNRQEPGELWVSIVEKAFAKLKGSYGALETINSAEALQTLTGFPARILDADFRNATINQNAACELFQAFQDWDLRGHLVVLRTPSNLLEMSPTCQVKTEQGFETAGFAFGRSFSLVRVVETAGVKLCKLRHPFGAAAAPWKGAWSVNDASWKAHPNVANVCGIGSASESEGAFWISMDDVLRYFAGATLCAMQRRQFDYRVKLIPSTLETLIPISPLALAIFVASPSTLTFSASGSLARCLVAAPVIGAANHQSPTQITYRLEPSQVADPGSLPRFSGTTRLQASPCFGADVLPYLVFVSGTVRVDDVVTLLSDTPVGKAFVVKFVRIPDDVARRISTDDVTSGFSLTSLSALSPLATQFQWKSQGTAAGTAAGEMLRPS